MATVVPVGTTVAGVITTSPPDRSKSAACPSTVTDRTSISTASSTIWSGDPVTTACNVTPPSRTWVSGS